MYTKIYVIKNKQSKKYDYYLQSKTMFKHLKLKTKNALRHDNEKLLCLFEITQKNSANKITSYKPN